MSREHWDRVAPVFCVSLDPHTYNNYQYRVILALSHFSLTGTVSTSPNLAKEGARSVTIIKADFHSVQNVARSIFSERSLLKCVKSTTANEICSA